MKKLLAATAALFLGASLAAQTATKPASPSQPDVNYAVGVLLGQSLAQANLGIQFNLEEVIHGLKDVMGEGGTPLLDIEQAKQMISEMVQAAQAKAEKEKTAKEDAWLAQHAQQTGVFTTASGLQYEKLKVGTGPQPRETDIVKVDYVGSLVDGTEFDSSVKRGEPAVFPLNQVIPAWTEGLQLMTVGSKYRFTVPSKLAYGAEGAGEVIPPYATTVFEVELLSIEPPEPEGEDQPQ